jgi:hypothetical protein
MEEEHLAPEAEEPPFPPTDIVGYTGETPVRPGESLNPNSPYAKIQGPKDWSLGAPIPASRSQKLRDALILVHDKINKKLTDLPAVQELYKELSKPFVKMEPILRELIDLINAYVNGIADHKSNLVEVFLLSVRLIESLNTLRDKVPSATSATNMARLKGENDGVYNRRRFHIRHTVDKALRRIQDYIWENCKSILNLHDIGSGPIPLSDEDSKEMIRLFGKMPQGTWAYGPMENPANSLFQQTQGRLEGLERGRLGQPPKAKRYTYTPFKSKHDKSDR